MLELRRLWEAAGDPVPMPAQASAGDDSFRAKVTASIAIQRAGAAPADAPSLVKEKSNSFVPVATSAVSSVREL